MKHIIIALSAATTALTFSTAASAQEFQVSAGGTYLFDSADTELSFTMATLRGTYYFTENWGVEAEGSFGLSGVDNYNNSSVDIEVPQQFGGYAVGRWHVGESGEFFGRVGLRTGSFDVSGFGSTADADYTGFSVGLGYTHFFNESLGLRGEFTTSGASLDGNLKPEGNLTSVSLSMAYKFGSNK